MSGGMYSVHTKRFSSFDVTSILGEGAGQLKPDSVTAPLAAVAAVVVLRVVLLALFVLVLLVLALLVLLLLALPLLVPPLLLVLPAAQAASRLSTRLTIKIL